MTSLMWFLLILLSLNIPPNSDGMQIEIKSLQSCDSNADYDILYDVRPYWEDKRHYLDMNATFKIPLSNDLKYNIKIEKLLGNTYIQVIKFGDRHSCNAVHKFLGEMAYGLEQAAGLGRGFCPIPKRKYLVRHFLVEGNTITLQSIPIGQLRITLNLINKSNKVVACAVSEIDNV